MSKRPIEQKKRKRVAKVFRRTPLPAYIDLVQWLIDRGHASSKRQARDLILAKKVKSESHVLGVATGRLPGPQAVLETAMGKQPTLVEQEYVQPYVEARLRSKITVLP